MDFTYLGLKVEEQWEVHLLPLVKTKRGQSLQEHRIKDSCSFAIGQPGQQMKLEAKMILLWDIGIKKDALDQL